MTSCIGTQGQHGDTLPPPVLKIQPPVAEPGSPPPGPVRKAHVQDGLPGWGPQPPDPVAATETAFLEHSLQAAAAPRHRHTDAACNLRGRGHRAAAALHPPPRARRGVCSAARWVRYPSLPGPGEWFTDGRGVSGRTEEDAASVTLVSQAASLRQTVCASRHGHPGRAPPRGHERGRVLTPGSRDVGALLRARPPGKLVLFRGLFSLVEQLFGPL